MIYPDWLGFHEIRKPLETGGGGYVPPTPLTTHKPQPRIVVDLLKIKENEINIDVSPIIKQDL